MSYTWQTVLDDLSGVAHGKTVSKITNIRSAGRRAADALLTQIDPKESQRMALITLYDDVDRYALPMTDLKDQKIFDIRPQTNRALSDNLSSRFSKEIDLKKQDNWFSVEDMDATRFLKISKRITPGAVGIDPLDAITYWTASGNASSLSVDTLYSITGGNSLKFNLASAGTSGLLTNSTITPRNLSAGSNTYAFFLWVYLPTASTNITSVKLRFGSSATAYWEATGSVHFGTQKQGWNLFRFDWPATASLGVPNSAAISYTRIEFIYTGTAVSGIRADKLYASLPKIWEVWYYSNCLFIHGGSFQDFITDENTVINLGVTARQIFVNEVALRGLQQVQGKDAAEDRDWFRNELYGDPSRKDKPGMYDKHKENNPSQAEKVTQTSYSNLRFKKK